MLEGWKTLLLPDQMTEAHQTSARHPDDGTRQLLQWGGSMVGTGLFCVLLLLTLFGGFTRQGATTNSGWFALIVALMCLPFGSLLLTLGVAKWLRNRRQ
jgi:hypothetical protein